MINYCSNVTDTYQCLPGKKLQKVKSVELNMGGKTGHFKYQTEMHFPIKERVDCLPEAVKGTDMHSLKSETVHAMRIKREKKDYEVHLSLYNAA